MNNPTGESPPPRTPDATSASSIAAPQPLAGPAMPARPAAASPGSFASALPVSPNPDNKRDRLDWWKDFTSALQSIAATAAGILRFPRADAVWGTR